MRTLGEKIAVVGVSASGKSTFARQLGNILGCEVIHMDAIMWKPGWLYVGSEETTKRLEAVSAEPHWIIEGYVKTAARTFLFERADTIIYLDYPRIVASWRYVKRWWKHRRHARPELAGSPEVFDFKFLKLVWSKGEAIGLNQFLSEVKDQTKIVVLRSPAEALRFLNSMSAMPDLLGGMQG
jgi:adenylate kinase family enzyme